MNKLLLAILVAGAWITSAQAQLVCLTSFTSNSPMSSVNSLFGR